MLPSGPYSPATATQAFSRLSCIWFDIRANMVCTRPPNGPRGLTSAARTFCFSRRASNSSVPMR